MKKAMYNYSVYDIIDCKYIAIDVSNQDVEDAIGLGKERISRHSQGGLLYKGRYRITANQITRVPELDIIEEKQLTAEDLKVMDEFDEAMEYLSKHYSKKFLSKILITKVAAG